MGGTGINDDDQGSLEKVALEPEKGCVLNVKKISQLSSMSWSSISNMEDILLQCLVTATVMTPCISPTPSLLFCVVLQNFKQLSVITKLLCFLGESVYIVHNFSALEILWKSLTHIGVH